MVYVTAPDTAVGVPEIIPVVGSKVKPVFVFRFGLMVNEVGELAVVGVNVVIGTPSP